MGLGVGKGRRAFPDRPRECEAALEHPMVQAKPFAHVAVRSVKRKSRSIGDARMFLQAASFAYATNAQV